MGKPIVQGMYVSQHLSFGTIRECPVGKAMVASRTREIRPSGMKMGAYGNASYGEIRNPSHIPKGCVLETLRLRLKCAVFLSRLRGQSGNWLSYLNDRPRMGGNAGSGRRPTVIPAHPGQIALLR